MACPPRLWMMDQPDNLRQFEDKARGNGTMATQTQSAQIAPDINPDALLEEVLARFPRVHLITDNHLNDNGT
ncbi:hypothetical protein [Armatimonas sp.]|uniref:hypothetical protein n=1 Tax=Armatimonas sp. TaxID=1872638 RepID=UPI00286BE4EF|nr:hypothetical protein [Armatimonas sp.]